MSNPAQIETAAIAVAVPEWLEEDTSSPTAIATPVNDSDIEMGSNAWLRDDRSPVASPTSSPTRANRPAAADDERIIHAPSRQRGTIRSPSRQGDAPQSPRPISPKPTPKPITTSNNSNNGNDNNNNGAPTSAAEAAAQKTWGQYFKESFKRDGRLLLITVGILIVMNIPVIKWALYPFEIFCTWIHELCHGLAALMLGGTIVKLEIFPDTSGLATYSNLRNWDYRWFVSSAGYQGTAVTGFFLLIFRRTKRGPRTGTMAIAGAMLLSACLWVRNVFGFCFVFGIGILLAVLAYFLPSSHIRSLYVCLAATTALNAITSIHDLFAYTMYINGEAAQTDAHTMAELVGGSSITWAVFWFCLAILLTLLGIVFAIPGPDEVADFACCGVCQDCGLFTPCNYPGQRFLERYRRNRGEAASGESGATSIPQQP